MKKFAMFWPRLVTASTVFCHAEETNDVNAAHALRPVSVWVKNQTSAATMAATRPIIHTMGPPVAAMTALNAPCTAVAVLVTALHASCAAWASFILPVSCWMAAMGPPMSIMSMTPLLTP